MTLYFDKVSDSQYLVTDKVGQILGNLVRDSQGTWGYLVSRQYIFFLPSELQELQDKIKSLQQEQ